MHLNTAVRIPVLTLISALLIGYIILHLQDYTRFRSLIEDAVSDATGRKLVIHGELDLALSLVPQLAVGKVTLSNADWASQPDMLEARLLRIRLRLLPLFRGDIEFSDILLEDTRLWLETGPGNSANWYFQPIDASGGAFAVRKLGIDELQVENLEIIFRNEQQAPRHYAIEHLLLSQDGHSDRLAVELDARLAELPLSIAGHVSQPGTLLAGSPLKLELGGKLDGNQLSVAGSVGKVLGAGGLNLALQLSGQNLAPLARRLEITIPDSQHFDLKANLTGDAESPALEQLHGDLDMNGLQLSVSGGIGDPGSLQKLNLDASVEASSLKRFGQLIQVDLPDSGPLTVQGRLSGSAGQLKLDDAQGELRNGQLTLTATGGIGDLLSLEAIDLDLTARGNSLSDLNGLLELELDLPATTHFNASGHLHGSARELSLRQLKASLRQAGSRLDVHGNVGGLAPLDAVDLRLKLAGQELAGLGRLFDKQWPALGGYAVTSRLIGSQRRLELTDLEALVDKSDFRGEARIEPGDRPRVVISLESGLIDFTALMDQFMHRDKTEQHSGGGAHRYSLSRNPLPFEQLEQFDADVKLLARNIKARDATLEFGTLRLKVDKGELQVDTLEASYRKTRASARFDIKAGNPPRLAGRFLVQGFEMGRFLKETDISDQIDVSADMAADLASIGRSPYDLVTNLDGVFATVFGKGSMPHFLDLLAEDLSRRVINIWGDHRQAGNLNCGVTQFTVQQGNAISNAFVFDTEIGYLKGKGSIDLASGKINFLLSPHPKNPSLFSLKTKLRISGTVTEPSVRPDAKSLALKGSRALSSLVLGPAGLLAPFVSLGARNAHPCDMQALRTRLEEIYR